MKTTLALALVVACLVLQWNYKPAAAPALSFSSECLAGKMAANKNQLETFLKENQK